MIDEEQREETSHFLPVDQDTANECDLPSNDLREILKYSWWISATMNANENQFIQKFVVDKIRACFDSRLQSFRRSLRKQSVTQSVHSRNGNSQIVMFNTTLRVGFLPVSETFELHITQRVYILSHDAYFNIFMFIHIFSYPDFLYDFRFFHTSN